MPDFKPEEGAHTPGDINQQLSTWNTSTISSALEKSLSYIKSGTTTPIKAAHDTITNSNTAWSKLFSIEYDTNVHIDDLNKKIDALTKQINAEKMNSIINGSIISKYEEVIKDLSDANSKLNRTKQLQQLLSQTNPTAHERLLNDDIFTSQFSAQEPCPCFVLSIDIRRSTELMLKARSPQQFGDFIINLCNGLKNIIIQNYGIF